MTDSQQCPKKPSPKQLRLLRRLAEERGVTFAYPQTFDQADREIKRLLRVKRSSYRDRHREDRAVREAMAQRGDAASVRADELSGYGSTATYR